jgi:hypothetical protein
MFAGADQEENDRGYRALSAACATTVVAASVGIVNVRALLASYAQP